MMDKKRLIFWSSLLVIVVAELLWLLTFHLRGGIG